MKPFLTETKLYKKDHHISQIMTEIGYQVFVEEIVMYKEVMKTLIPQKPKKFPV